MEHFYNRATDMWQHATIMLPHITVCIHCCSVKENSKLSTASKTEYNIFCYIKNQIICYHVTGYATASCIRIDTLGVSKAHATIVTTIIDA